MKMTETTQTTEPETPSEWTFAEAERPTPACLRAHGKIRINTHRGVIIDLDEQFDIRLPDKEAEMPLLQEQAERLFTERIELRVKEALNRFVREEVEAAGERADEADAPDIPTTASTESGGGAPTVVVTVEKAEIAGDDRQLFFPEMETIVQDQAGKAA
jgi:hypothetical protein